MEEGEPSPGPLRCSSEDVCLCRDECLIFESLIVMCILRMTAVRTFGYLKL